MGANDEPSNPFKNPRKAVSEKRATHHSSRKGGRGRGKSGPPSPPGSKPISPPVAPSGSKRTTTDTPTPKKSPARAGKSVGLRKQADAVQSEAARKTDERARQFIEATRAKVKQSQSANEEVIKKKTEPTNPFKKAPKTSGTQRKGGRFGKRNRPQGQVKRVKKLDQGKQQEFKYDLRRILEDEGVEDEHRSNVLSQTIAKGQRQGVEEAKAFLDEKVKSGVISDSCYMKIEKLIDSLTTRR